MNLPQVAAGRPAIELLKLAYSANQPAMLIGPHGIGKSEMVRQASVELGIQFIDRDLSLLEPPDLVGLPVMSAHGDVTVYRPPAFLPRQGQGVLLMEELNRCPAYMRAPCLQLLTARRLNDYVLPPGWLPAACINPADESYEVFELDPALLSRFMAVRVVPDRAEWLCWAQKNHVHSSVVAYVTADPDVFNQPDSNPRSWTYVANFMTHNGAGKATLRAAVEGVIGTERATAFFSFLRQPTKPISAKAVLSRQASATTIENWIKEGRIDLVEGTLTNVLAHLQSANHVRQARANRGWWCNLGRFFAKLPGDLRERAEKHMREHGHAPPKAGEATS